MDGDRCARCCRHMDELSRSDDARWPNCTQSSQVAIIAISGRIPVATRTGCGGMRREITLHGYTAQSPRGKVASGNLGERDRLKGIGQRDRSTGHSDRSAAASIVTTARQWDSLTSQFRLLAAFGGRLGTSPQIVNAFQQVAEALDPIRAGSASGPTTGTPPQTESVPASPEPTGPAGVRGRRKGRA